jgi:hypothetical protein
VPIDAPSAPEALRKFTGYLNRTLNRTLTQRRLVNLIVGDAMEVVFRQDGRAVAVPLQTRYGPMGLFIGQTCIAHEVENGLYRLATSSYRYALSLEDEEEPVLRWEYVREWPHPDERWARHHIQGEILVDLGNAQVSLNQIHTPTGYVTLEEVIRFCIHDLGCPPLEHDWHEVLERSYQRFKTELTPPNQ